MKVLIVGSGGREHALAWGISRSPDLTKLFVAPGNGGTGTLGENVEISADDIDGLRNFSRSRTVDLTIVGPEAPLAAGIADAFEESGLLCFGPSRNAAKLEGSKVFCKEFMKRRGIPTADFAVFVSPDDAKEHIRRRGSPMVIKADGLAQGKGVYVVDCAEEAVAAVDEIMLAKRFGDSGSAIVIEDRLEGEEISVHAVCSGEKAALLPASQDHKRVFDGDKGPNTGGMGAYAPVPFVTAAMKDTIMEQVIKPALKGMVEEGAPYKGVLYAGLMMTESGPKVLEFNVRFGDPETQVLIPLLQSDLLGVLYSTAKGALREKISVLPGTSAAAVVVASRGYPGSYEKGFEISGLDDAVDDRRMVFHAGTAVRNSQSVTAGGRVLSVAALGSSLSGALEYAYDGISKISFEGAFYRRDIGRRALAR